MNQPKVYNKRHSGIPKDAIYVGRPSPWGNPFSKGTKQQNIESFRNYAEKRCSSDPKWLEPLRGKSVICWCAPHGCHGDILIQLANQDEPDWDAWCAENEPVDEMLDKPSDWERIHLSA